ncbi:fluoride efflux transporter CrcB [Neobacillus mesonae]|nr:fluoride efflux transporter CrcB [Neobacillus mesonae]
MIWAAGLGGIAGAMLRYSLGRYISKHSFAAATSFPWGTWIINISGSLLLGILYVLTATGRMPALWWAVLGIGFCGSYTTFSTFGYETLQLVMKHRAKQAALYVVSSVLIGIVAASAGIWITSYFVR